MRSRHCIGLLLFSLLLGVGCDQQEETSNAGGDGNAATATAVKPGTELREADLVSALKATKARYIVVSVFAPYCGYCLTEAIQLAERREEWRQKGVAVIGLGLCDEPSGCVKFFENTGGRADYPLYLAPWAEKKFSVEATPTILILGPRGDCLFSASGSEGVSPHEAVEAKLRELLKSKRSSAVLEGQSRWKTMSQTRAKRSPQNPRGKSGSRSSC